MSGVLFDGYEPTEPDAKLSPDRRRTERQAQLIASGRHPLAAVVVTLRLHPDAARDPNQREGGPRCGNCVHRVLIGGHTRDYPKCAKSPTRSSASAATDCRAWWPGCTDWEEAP